MMTALVFERNAAWYGEAVRLLDHTAHWAAVATGPDGTPRLTDPLVRERLARGAIGNEVSNLLGWRAAWLASTGVLPSTEGTMAKLFTTEHYQRSANDFIDLLGADGLRRHGSPGAPADGWIEAIYRHSQVTTIYGGTSEVLPRHRRRARPRPPPQPLTALPLLPLLPLLPRMFCGKAPGSGHFWR